MSYSSENSESDIQNNTDKDSSSELKKVVAQGVCPNCGSEDVEGIAYPCDNEVWFNCCSCDWSQTYNLSEANDAGYYVLWDVTAVDHKEF